MRQSCYLYWELAGDLGSGSGSDLLEIEKRTVSSVRSAFDNAKIGMIRALFWRDLLGID